MQSEKDNDIDCLLFADLIIFIDTGLVMLISVSEPEREKSSCNVNDSVA
jgi:hypothetical protein